MGHPAQLSTPLTHPKAAQVLLGVGRNDVCVQGHAYMHIRVCTCVCARVYGSAASGSPPVSSAEPLLGSHPRGHSLHPHPGLVGRGAVVAWPGSSAMSVHGDWQLAPLEDPVTPRAQSSPAFLRAQPRPLTRTHISCCDAGKEPPGARVAGGEVGALTPMWLQGADWTQPSVAETRARPLHLHISLASPKPTPTSGETAPCLTLVG